MDTASYYHQRKHTYYILTDGEDSMFYPDVKTAIGRFYLHGGQVVLENGGKVTFHPETYGDDGDDDYTPAPHFLHITTDAPEEDVIKAYKIMHYNLAHYFSGKSMLLATARTDGFFDTLFHPRGKREEELCAFASPHHKPSKCTACAAGHFKIL